MTRNWTSIGWKLHTSNTWSCDEKKENLLQMTRDCRRLHCFLSCFAGATKQWYWYFEVYVRRVRFKRCEKAAISRCMPPNVLEIVLFRAVTGVDSVTRCTRVFWKTINLDVSGIWTGNKNAPTVRNSKKPKHGNEGGHLPAHLPHGCEKMTSRVKHRFRFLGCCEILVCVHLPDQSKVSNKTLRRKK